MGAKVTALTTGLVLPMVTVLLVTGVPEVLPSLGVTVHVTSSPLSNRAPFRVFVVAAIPLPATVHAKSKLTVSPSSSVPAPGVHVSVLVSVAVVGVRVTPANAGAVLSILRVVLNGVPMSSPS